MTSDNITHIIFTDHTLFSIFNTRKKKYPNLRVAMAIIFYSHFYKFWKTNFSVLWNYIVELTPY